MKDKSVWVILLCVVLMLGLAALAGCGTDAGSGGPETGPGGGTDTADNAEEEQVYQVAVCFANKEYIDTGNEALDKFNIYTEEITSAPEDVYLDALELLREPSDESDSTMITEQVVFNDAYLEGDTVYVDFKSVGPNSGSLGEGFLVSQIVNTLLSFDEVTQVQFLVNGEVTETLMGHVGTAEPFTKDVFTE
ncbi:MAG TPA: GerMN domain-containing protein [Anaerovoracaceae bacterium]|nr:GerMN domain-containing protein [Anaerovoracaceae bacterium]